MKLSIIIPSYNQGRYIGRTIESILNQHDEDVEIIVMDGGSTDETTAVLDRYRDRLAIVVSEKDGGQSDALQKGYARATGDYIGWQNSDDVYMPGAFRRFREKLAADMKRGEVADVYFGNQCVIGPEDELLYGKIFGPFRLNYLLYAGWNITNQSTFFSRNVLQRIGGVDAKLHYAMDFDLYVRLARAGARFAWDDFYWGGFRIHDLSKGSTLHATRDQEYRSLRTKYITGYRPEVPWASQFRPRRVAEKVRRVGWLILSGRFPRFLREKFNPSAVLFGQR